MVHILRFKILILLVWVSRGFTEICSPGYVSCDIENDKYCAAKLHARKHKLIEYYLNDGANKTIFF